MTVIGMTLMVAGALLGLIGGLGVARLGTTLARTHAASKPASLGMVLVALGAGVAARSWALVGVALLMGIFQFLTAPIAGHLIGRAASDVSTETGRTAASFLSPTGRLGLFVQVSLLWVVLWRDLSPGVLLTGGLIGAALALLIGGDPISGLRLGAVRTMATYTASLIRSNLRTAIQVIRMGPSDVSETLVWCDLETRSARAAVFTANAITFSPGTLALEISDSVPYRIAVHALGRTDHEVTTEVSRLERTVEHMYPSG